MVSWMNWKLVSGTGGYWVSGKRRLERRQGSLVEGLAGHGINFRFYSKHNGNPWKGLEQRNASILREHFDCG